MIRRCQWCGEVVEHEHVLLTNPPTIVQVCSAKARTPYTTPDLYPAAFQWLKSKNTYIRSYIEGL